MFRELFSYDFIKNRFVKFFAIFAKLFLISCFIFGLISLFFNIGMSVDYRFGLPSFLFIYDFSHQLTAAILFSISIISCSNTKRITLFLFLCCVDLVLTLKGPPIICSFLIIIFYFYYKKNKHIKLWIVLLSFFAIVLLGSYQINTYLMIDDSPRTLFLTSSILIANRFVIFGSGFATFGSDMAAKHYSPIYYEYGFNLIRGMTPDNTSFLLDNGIAMYIGQNGYLGFIFFLLFIYLLFRLQYKENISPLSKCLYTAIFLQYIVHSFGSAILCSSSGMVGFISLALLLQNKGNVLATSKIKAKNQINFYDSKRNRSTL